MIFLNFTSLARCRFFLSFLLSILLVLSIWSLCSSLILSYSLPSLFLWIFFSPPVSFLPSGNPTILMLAIISLSFLCLSLLDIFYLCFLLPSKFYNMIFKFMNLFVTYIHPIYLIYSSFPLATICGISNISTWFFLTSCPFLILLLSSFITEYI